MLRWPSFRATAATGQWTQAGAAVAGLEAGAAAGTAGFYDGPIAADVRPGKDSKLDVRLKLVAGDVQRAQPAAHPLLVQPLGDFGLGIPLGEVDEDVAGEEGDRREVPGSQCALNRDAPHESGIWAFEDLSSQRPVKAELTAREREVAARLLDGMTSKEIGKALTISHRTVEIYRARLMRKYRANTTADLVHKLMAGA